MANALTLFTPAKRSKGAVSIGANKRRTTSSVAPYVRIARPDHWIKQLFIIPGVMLALLLSSNDKPDMLAVARNVLVALIATSFIASANYVINEWLDRDFDKFHPIKKRRPAVSVGLSAPIVYAEWIVLTVAGLFVGYGLGWTCFASLAALWVMGIVYNVKPLRTKDVAYLDVLSESVNNALRLLIGWFAVLPNVLPPSSLMLGYWMAGAYLMAIKRFSEYRAIGDPKVAGLYRRSFKSYTSQSLLDSSLFYAMLSVFLLGIFLVKYHIEYVIAMPFLCGLYVKYFNLAFKEDSAVQAPEKLYRERGLMVYVACFIVLFALLTFFRIPALHVFMDAVLIGV